MLKWTKNSVPQLVILVAGLTLLAYASSFQAPFLASEVQEILENPEIHDFSKVHDIVRIDRIFKQSLPKLTYSLNYLIGHRTSWGYHLVNLAIHLSVGLVLFLVVREWLTLFPPGNEVILKGLPLLASAIHLFHPLNSQAVILVSSRPILLAGLFYLLSFWFLGRYLRELKTDPAKARGSVNFLMVMTCFTVGCASHPILLTFPILGWILHRFYDSDSPVEWEVFAFIQIPWIIYIIYQFSTPSPEAFREFAQHGNPSAMYFLTQVKAFVFYYLPKALIPFPLNLDPDFPPVQGWGDWTWMLAVALAGVLFWGLRRSGPILVQWAGIWSFLLFIAFYGPGISPAPVSEPYFYLPGIGIHLLLAMGLLTLWTRFAGSRWIALAVPVIFLVLTFNRGGDYRSEVVLWETTAAHSPDKARVHYELGRAYLQQEKVDPAEKELARVLELDPKNIPARIMLGKINIERENYSSALESYLALIRQNIKTPAVKFNTGLCYLEMGQAGQALPYLEEAVDKQPGSAYGHFILGRAYHQSRRLNDALKQFRTSVQINPDDPKTHYHMGQVFWDLKSYFFADASFQKAYQLDPQYVDALNNLISSSMLFKQYDQAITYLNRLLEINPDDPNARQLLTAAQRLRDRPAPKVPARPEQFH